MSLEDIVVGRTSVDLRALSRGNPLTNQVQQRLLDLGFLDPPVDGDFGPISQLALQQFGVHRDLNKDFKRAGDAVFEGSSFGINQHMGFDRPEDNVGAASAGCLVGRSREEHKEFMRIVKADPRRKASQGYKYLSTIIEGSDLHKMA